MTSLSGTLLVDNGSLQPAAIKKLREVAHALSLKLGEKLDPVSVLHSDKIPAEQLDGVAAETLEAVLRRRLGAGVTVFKIIPLFVGPSAAITTGLQELTKNLKKEFPAFALQMAPWLGEGAGLAEILADHVDAALLAGEFTEGKPVRVALVDHGSPTREVTAVRDRLAGLLASRLGERVSAVAPCSMERRPGDRYAFNDPLLEVLLQKDGWREAPVIVAMLFLLPGRHAGPEGDVAQICGRAGVDAPKLKTRMTPLLADHPGLIDCLAARAKLARAIG